MKMVLITFLFNKDFIYVVRVKTSKRFSKPQGGFSKTYFCVPVDFKNIWVQVWYKLKNLQLQGYTVEDRIGLV